MCEKDDIHDHDLGLSHDLPLLLSRRRALGLLASGVGTIGLAACGFGESRGSSGATGATGETSIPEETAGPFPADGSNGPDVLRQSGIVRRDITTSFGGATGTAEGVPTTIELRLLDIARGGGPLEDAAVYLWHCNRDGAYSLYDSSIADQNYLRGVQASNEDGKISFVSIFPACYDGRWPHIHFEVYESLDAATAGTSKLRTSQLALPKGLCESIYSSAEGYDSSLANLSQVSLDTDMVFSDGYASQLPSWSGSMEGGIALQLNVGV
jgi:protocatechuate 3,4-dioxygenase beta subunit